MSDTLNIYWSSANFTLDEESWNMLYSDPKNILSGFYDKRNTDAKHRSFLSCPAFKDKLKNVFMFNNIFDSEYSYKDNFVVLFMDGRMVEICLLSFIFLISLKINYFIRFKRRFYLSFSHLNLTLI